MYQFMDFGILFKLWNSWRSFNLATAQGEAVSKMALEILEKDKNQH